MQIADLLRPERIVARSAVRTKQALLEELAGLLDSEGKPETTQHILSSLLKREKLGATGLSHGVALPHGRSADLEHASAALIRLEHPIDFGAVDGQPVNLVFGLVVPEHFTDQHLLFLSEIAERFSDKDTIVRLLAAPDADHIYRLLSPCKGSAGPA